MNISGNGFLDHQIIFNFFRDFVLLRHFIFHRFVVMIYYFVCIIQIDKSDLINHKFNQIISVNVTEVKV